MISIRLWVFAFAIACIAASPRLAPAAQDADLYEAAKKAGETEVTWYQSHIRTEASEKIGQAFTAKYPGIKVNVFNSTAAVAFQRLTQDLKAGAVQADIFGTTDISHMPTLKAQDSLEKFVPETVSGMVPSVKQLNDPEGYYTITYAALVALTYNRDKVKPENAPKHWTDLTDKKWEGQVTIGSPNYSGTLGGWSVMIKRLYGMEFFQKLADNKPLVGRSIDDALIHLNSGESSIAAGDVASTSRSIARGNPLGISYPEDGALLLVGPTALIKGAKHPNAGKLFINYLLTPDAAKVIVGEFEQAVIIDAPAPPSGVPLKDIKTVSNPLEEILKELPGIKEKWRDLFGS
jgi:iron(III) transport system substrate-binding protein